MLGSRALRRQIKSALLERAEKLGAQTGHTTPGYRGMETAYDDATAAARAADGKPQWLSSKPDMAETYAGESGVMLPAMIRRGKNLEVDARGARWSDIDAREIPDKEVARRLRRKMRDALSTSYVNSRDLADAAREAGYDSVTIRNMRHQKGSVRRRSLIDRFRTETDDVHAVFKPEDIRAQTAKFDPKRAGEASIMAGTATAAAIPALERSTDDPRQRRRRVRDALAA